MSPIEVLPLSARHRCRPRCLPRLWRLFSGATVTASTAVATVWLATTLSGCAAPQAVEAGPMGPVAPEEPAASTVEPAASSILISPLFHCDPALEPQDLAARHLLSTHERLVGQTPSELVQAANRANPLSIQATMDQALALGMTHTPGDLARAQSLLDVVLRSNTPQAQPWHRLARLLSTLYAEQRRADEQVERVNQQIRDVQRDSQRRLDQLNDKLEALKAIERSLNTRSGPAPKPSP